METMRFSALCITVAALFPIFLGPDRIVAQASVTVSVLDPVYRDIDKLVAHDLVDVFIRGQRPYSRMEIARITAEALAKLPRLQPELTSVRRILTDLQREYAEEMAQLATDAGSVSNAVRLVEQVEAAFSLADSPPRAFVENGLGSLDAAMNPLLQGREGRNVVDGGTASLESTHWAQFSKHFAVFARPRFQLGLTRNGQPDVNEVVLQNLNAHLVVGNFEVEVGRDNLSWGQGRNAGLLVSHNARGLDMVKIANARPFRLPWLFRHLGPTKLSLFLADLGPNQVFPGSLLLGYKMSFLPFRSVEIGASLVNEFGGEGSPPSSFWEKVADAMPFLEDFVGATRFSNKIAGLDMRIRIPRARGLEIFAEAMIDDWDLDRLKSMLWQDAAYIFGVTVPRLTNAATVGFSAELHHTGIRFYRHPQFISGVAMDGFIIGDNLGPDGNAAYAWIDWDVDDRNLLSFGGAYERRSTDRYSALTASGVAGPEGFFNIEQFPREKRYRATVSWRGNGQIQGRRMSVRAGVGYERVRGFDFVAGSGRDNFLGEMALQVFFN